MYRTYRILNHTLTASKELHTASLVNDRISLHRYNGKKDKPLNDFEKSCILNVGKTVN